MDLLKRIVFWNYERASWQWDVLCIICMIFIFLTPKTWFEKKDRLATRTTRLIVKADDFSTERSALENKIKELSGNPNAEIVGWREKKDKEGSTYYEIEIR
jgi:hypothetical protein